MSNNWNIPHDKLPWNPSKYVCPHCEEIIWSPRPGAYVACKCDECFVDQTRHYIRVGGPAVPLKEPEEK